MKVKLPTLYQDTEISVYKVGEELEVKRILEDDFFLDGPVSRRVAVIDLDPDGGLHPGAKISPPEGDKRRSYQIDGRNFTSPEYRAVMVFGSVWKTINMFEHDEILGSDRNLTWAFGAPQLLVVPRAGDWANAFYERESHSLQFFYFDADGVRIHTCLSADIVAHETGHAILDGIAPDLYDAKSPQALAIHESVADLVAIVRALDNKHLVDAIVTQESWSIEESSQFTALAEKFGRALSQGRRSYLRNAWNEKSLKEDAEDSVARDDPHALSEVLTGALYRVLAARYQTLYDGAIERGKAEFPARGYALGVAARFFSRFVFRALDYLPPGEVSFADFVRAVLAADQAAYPREENDSYRQILRDECVKRGIAQSASDLAVKTGYVDEAVGKADYEALRDSDWFAHQFVDDQRALFRIPDDVAFELRPRLDVTKQFGHSGSHKEHVRELVIKVCWEETEANQIGSGFPQERLVSKGTTLVVDWDQREVRALLTSNNDERQQQDRDSYLRRLIDEELLVPGPALSYDGEPRQGVVGSRIRGGRMHVAGTCRTLHLAGE